MHPGKIDLSQEEEALLCEIELDQAKLFGSDLAEENGQRAQFLFRSLEGRSAIPNSRIEWFTNAEFNFGRKKGSRKEIFTNNAGSEEEFYTHPNFLSILNYFVHGAELPDDLKSEFVRRVEGCGHVNGNDAIDLGKWTRSEIRSRGLDSEQAAEEFLKLALDLEIWSSWAKTIYKSVKKAPRTRYWEVD